MQPGGERRLAAEATDFAKKLDKDFLRQVFGLDHISGHAQTERVNAPVVPLIQLLEGFHVAFGGLLRQLVIRRSRSLGFDTSHGFARAHACFSLNDRPTLKNSGRNDCLRARVLVSDLTLAVTSGGAVPRELTQAELFFL